jgi:hypothetical protein
MICTPMHYRFTGPLAATFHRYRYLSARQESIPSSNPVPVPTYYLLGNSINQSNEAYLGKVLLSQGAELAVVHTASSGQHHPGPLVVGVDIL